MPDLVFSEMKFLQKHKDQPEAVHPSGRPKKKRKKNHTQSKEEEISAYFTSVRPALAEKDVEKQASESPTKPSLPRDNGRGRQTSSLADHAIPTIVVSDKGPSHLGFGGRGPRHGTGSYISWSESVRAPSATSRHGHASSGAIADHSEAAYAAKVRVNIGAESALHSPTPPSIQRRLTNGSGDRLFVSSSTPANQRTSRARSYSQRTCSMDPSGFKQQSGRRHTTDIAASPLSMPAAIPVQPEAVGEPREPGFGLDRAAGDSTRRPSYPLGTHRSSVLDDEHPNTGVVESSDPHTSSTLDRLLQQCNRAFDQYRRQVTIEASQERLDQADTESISVSRDGRTMAENASFAQIRSLPTVRFAGIEAHYPPVPFYDGPNIYEEQERWLERQRSSVMTGRSEHLGHYFMDTGEEVFYGDEEFEYLRDHGRSDWEDMRSSGEFGAGSRGYYQLEGSVQPLVAHETAAGGVEDREVVARGFWRPNKLY